MTRLLLLPWLAVAAEAARNDDAFRFFQEEAQVYTAARRPQQASEAPASVEVITAEEIRASGAVDLWDVLRFRAGMYVSDGRTVDGNRAVVSVRGFPRSFVTELQVLVDGRSVYSPFLGGVFWDQLPVQLQDIERIEVVRGPNAALYGSNAVLGVVNIITRTPAVDAVSVSGYGGNRGARSAAAAVERAGWAHSVRLSYTYRSQDGNPGPSSTRRNDFLESDKVNLRGRWQPASGTRVEYLAGGSWQSVGIPAEGDPKGRFPNHFQMLKLTQAAPGDGEVEWYASRDDSLSDISPYFLGRVKFRSYQYHSEALYRRQWRDRTVHGSAGASYRYLASQSDQTYAGDPKQRNRVLRGFAHLSARLADALTLVGGASLEDSDTGGLEPGYQTAALVTPAQGHTLRLSHAQASTIPALFHRAANYRLAADVLFVGNPRLQAQRLHSYELGYLGSASDLPLGWEATVFYMDSRRRNFTALQRTAPLPTLSFDNRNRALARGAELKAVWNLAKGAALHSNYTYAHITDRAGDATITEQTPGHVFNVGGRAPLPAGLSGSLQFGYADAHRKFSSARFTPTGLLAADIPAYWRMDARLAYAARPGLELFVAGQNLLSSRHTEFPDTLEVPRTVQAGARWELGTSR